jgi:hypothetical protein
MSEIIELSSLPEGAVRGAHLLVTREEDSAFLDRQFRSCFGALLRVGALAPGEVERLERTPAPTEELRRARAAEHERIAHAVLKAVQEGRMREEEFNLWSSRRREGGVPVKERFEVAYAACLSPELSRRRGTLTGVVRAYQHLSEELINCLLGEVEAARSAEDLLAVERSAVARGVLRFEPVAREQPSGWPLRVRSSGRLRNAGRLRDVLDHRQQELPMAADCARAVLAEMLPVLPVEEVCAPTPAASERVEVSSRPTLFRWVAALLSRVFN